MMRGFQIWPQNSNRVIFDLLFGQETVENMVNRVFASFRRIGGQNVVKCYLVLNLRQDLSSHHFASPRSTFDIIFTF